MNTPSIDRIGVSKLETLFSKYGWSFREQFTKDYGIDAQVEIVNNDRPTGQLIAIQIKSGESYFTESNEHAITYRPDSKHVDYWLKHDLPVIITLYHPLEDVFYWIPVANKTVQKTEKAYKILIPRSNILNEENCAALKKVFRLDVPNYRFKRLLLDLEWMKLIENGESVYAEFDDWINKSLSRTSIRIYFDRGTDHKEIVIPQHYWAGHDSFDIIEKYIPWADYEMDEDGYEEYMKEVYELECYMSYDKESNQTFYTQSFEEWYIPPDDIRPIYGDGEIVTYRVKLKLNEIGESFIKLTEYLYDDSSFEYKSFSVDDL